MRTIDPNSIIEAFKEGQGERFNNQHIKVNKEQKISNNKQSAISMPRGKYRDIKRRNERDEKDDTNSENCKDEWLHIADQRSQLLKFVLRLKKEVKRSEKQLEIKVILQYVKEICFHLCSFGVPLRQLTATFRAHCRFVSVFIHIVTEWVLTATPASSCRQPQILREERRPTYQKMKRIKLFLQENTEEFH